MPNTYACKGVSNPNVPMFPPRVCTLVLFIKNAMKALKCKPSAEFGGNIGIFGLKTTFHAYVLGEHTR